jgi:hypothetical protein
MIIDRLSIHRAIITENERAPKPVKARDARSPRSFTALVHRARSPRSFTALVHRARVRRVNSQARSARRKTPLPRREARRTALRYAV